MKKSISKAIPAQRANARTAGMSESAPEKKLKFEMIDHFGKLILKNKI